MTKKDLFCLSDSAIESNSTEIIDIAKDLWTHPETGYREIHSSALLVSALEKLGFSVRKNLAITGFRADLDTGIPGPVIAVMGEYDALLIPSHPEAVNGVAHSCGHHTCAAGLIAAIRSFATSALRRPIVSQVAKSWRFMLLGWTTSKSTRRKRPTPERASASTV